MNDEGRDSITDVLRECEQALRELRSQGRLTDGALARFIQLAQSVGREMDRRRQGDRRGVARSTADRRAASPAQSECRAAAGVAIVS